MKKSPPKAAVRSKRPRKLMVYILDDGYAFIQDPIFRGKWIRVRKEAALYGCPTCKAKTGEPCKFKDNPRRGTGVHHQRMNPSERLPKNLRGVTVVE